MAYAKVNLNDQIRVKLTEVGYQHWATTYNEMLRYNEPLSFFKDRADADGYVAFELWLFIQTFGGAVDQFGPRLFDMDVLIQYEGIVLKNTGVLNGQVGDYQAIDVVC